MATRPYILAFTRDETALIDARRGQYSRDEYARIRMFGPLVHRDNLEPVRVILNAYVERVGLDPHAYTRAQLHGALPEGELRDALVRLAQALGVPRGS